MEREKRGWLLKSIAKEQAHQPVTFLVSGKEKTERGRKSEKTKVVKKKRRKWGVKKVKISASDQSRYPDRAGNDRYYTSSQFDLVLKDNKSCTSTSAKAQRYHKSRVCSKSKTRV